VSEIKDVSKLITNRNVKIIDLGAGSGWYWDEIDEKLNGYSVEVVLFDASVNQPIKVLDNIKINKIRGLIPSELQELQTDEFDIVIAFDLIEHLSKEDGYRMLYEMDRLARHSSFIFTPNGFIWQPPSENNPFNAHISGWTPAELKYNGWRDQHGHTGYRRFRGPYGLPKNWIKNWVFQELDAAAEIITSRFPRQSFAFSAIKRRKNLRIANQDL
jgi:hypothetical protein